MPRLLNSKANITLIVLAALLSAFNGLLSILTVLVFSGHESTRLWVMIYLPAVLWIPALGCLKMPKVGFVTYAVILASALFLCVNPLHRADISAALGQCSYNLRFALIGAVLLLINVFLPRQTESVESSLRGAA